MALQIQKKQTKIKKSLNKKNKKINETIRGKYEHESEEQKNTINNLKTFYKAREEVIILFDDCTTIISKAKYEVRHRKRLKILTLRQMLQRLPIALAQVKAGNTYKL